MIPPIVWPILGLGALYLIARQGTKNRDPIAIEWTDGEVAVMDSFAKEYAMVNPKAGVAEIQRVTAENFYPNNVWPPNEGDHDTVLQAWTDFGQLARNAVEWRNK